VENGLEVAVLVVIIVIVVSPRPCKKLLRRHRQVRGGGGARAHGGVYVPKQRVDVGVIVHAIVAPAQRGRSDLRVRGHRRSLHHVCAGEVGKDERSYGAHGGDRRTAQEASKLVLGRELVA
jgi:hypothetical protein